MQLRERQYQSRLGSRPSRKGSSQEFRPITNGHQRPPLQIWRNVVRWAPLAVVAAIIIYLLDRFVF